MSDSVKKWYEMKEDGFNGPVGDKIERMANEIMIKYPEESIRIALEILERKKEIS